MLKKLIYLNARTTLRESDRRLLWNLEKGYTGEEQFDTLLAKHLTSDALILNDLLLKNSGSTFQIDTLVISGGTIHLYEIKNYSGDYILTNEGLSTVSGKIIRNPTIQLARTKQNLTNLIRETHFKHKIQAHVVFVHPTFTLYNASTTDSFIFPTQIETHLIKINDQLKMSSQKDRQLAEILVDGQETQNQHEQTTPEYPYEQLEKGVVCPHCNTLSLSSGLRMKSCLTCGHKVPLESAILESVRQYQVLFPEGKVTTNQIDDWCGKQTSTKSIRKVLETHFTMVGTNKLKEYI
ncbi:nuclease-related domain-containing protein [Marinilactibacillus sp. GCM10026970]|uniref:nuclease-related domain-containing protein n=1 Tax=Marinilactibacillus sp. GCM10026970 TaxID=3252642 RepID=UPI00361A0C5E